MLCHYCVNITARKQNFKLRWAVGNLIYINNDQSTRKTAIPQEKFLDLVNLVLTTTWYTFNSQIYQKTDEVAKEDPASSTAAEIYM